MRPIEYDNHDIRPRTAATLSYDLRTHAFTLYARKAQTCAAVRRPQCRAALRWRVAARRAIAHHTISLRHARQLRAAVYIARYACISPIIAHVAHKMLCVPAAKHDHDIHAMVVTPVIR